MVSLANTIVYPLTMVVKFVYAPITNVAMPRILGVNGLTIRTETLGIIFLHKFVKVKSFNMLDMSGVQECSSEKEKVYN